MVRTNPAAHLPTIAKAFGWTVEDAKAELAKVHLANLPENIAFFNGTIDSAGSFGYLYETAAYVYGSEMLGNVPEAERFVSTAALEAIDKTGQFKQQKASITPILANATAENSGDELTAERNALLSKNILFEFEPNSSKLQVSADNDKDLRSIARLLQISPGSRVLLRGHADGSRLPEFKQQGEAKLRQMTLVLKNLSKSRCTEIKQLLEEGYKLDADRIETQGVGTDEPTGQGPDRDRRVEVQWFTAE
jgi:NitT/TauT family transport system substrate-binding protein